MEVLYGRDTCRHMYVRAFVKGTKETKGGHIRCVSFTRRGTMRCIPTISDGEGEG